ncbi:unnamed protein product [Choristocarpus tenellus]
MQVLGSCILPILFPPEDRVHNVTFRVVEGLPYGMVLGAAFCRQNKSVLSFREGEGFRPAPNSPWIPFVRAVTPRPHDNNAPLSALGEWQASMTPTTRPSKYHRLSPNKPRSAECREPPP